MKIHHLAISVRSLKRSAGFYKRFFGFEEAKRFERKDLGARAVFLESDEFQLELWEFKKQAENKDDFFRLEILGLKHLAFGTKNIEQDFKRFKSRSRSELRKGASGGRYFFLEDPDGLPIEIYQP